MDALTRETVRTRPRFRSRTWVMAGLCLMLVAAIVWAIWFFPAAPPAAKSSDPFAGKPVPVVTAAAETRDVPIFLDGLGTVQAYYTVTMKAMVDGPLTAVNFREGQDVHAGDVLAQIDPRAYKAAFDSAVAKKAQDEAQLANARLDLARYQKLVANNYTSAQQADTAKAQVAQLEAQVAQDQAAIDSARTNLSYTTITAPINGLTGMRQVDPGNIVHATDITGIVMLTQIQPISVVFTLPQQMLPSVSAAMAAGPVEVLATTQEVAGATPRLLDKGTLTVLDNQVDPTTGTIKLKATFPNAGRQLWPGGFVSVRLRADIARGAVVVPPAAIQRGPRGAYVFVIESDKSRRQPVMTGYEDQGVSIITDGVHPGDAVVVDGASRLSDGTKVEVVKAAAEPVSLMDQSAPPGTRQRR